MSNTPAAPAYRVVSTIQSVDETNPPVEMVYYTGSDLAVAIVAAGQAATTEDARYTRNVSVRIDFL